MWIFDKRFKKYVLLNINGDKTKYVRMIQLPMSAEIVNGQLLISTVWRVAHKTKEIVFILGKLNICVISN